IDHIGPWPAARPLGVGDLPSGLFVQDVMQVQPKAIAKLEHRLAWHRLALRLRWHELGMEARAPREDAHTGQGEPDDHGPKARGVHALPFPYSLSNGHGIIGATLRDSASSRLLPCKVEIAEQ